MSAAREEAERLHGKISILSNAGTRIKIIATALADARREGWGGQWVSVEDRLPAAEDCAFWRDAKDGDAGNGKVLGGRHVNGYWVSVLCWFYDLGSDGPWFDSKITHWQPLPPAPPAPIHPGANATDSLGEVERQVATTVPCKKCGGLVANCDGTGEVLA